MHYVVLDASFTGESGTLMYDDGMYHITRIRFDGASRYISCSSQMSFAT